MAAASSSSYETFEEASSRLLPAEPHSSSGGGLYVSSDSQDSRQVADKPPTGAYPIKPVGAILALCVLQSFAQNGLQAILALFFYDGLSPTVSLSDNFSSVMVNLYMAVYSVFGVWGGWLCDHVVGNYTAEVWGTVAWAVGAVLMWLALFGSLMHQAGSFAVVLMLTCAGLGLTLSAVGYGVVNPLQSVFVADQFEPGQEQWMTRSFSLFYMFCNIGNVLGEFGGPVLHQYVSYNAALGAIAVAQVASAFVLIGASKWYRKVPPVKPMWHRLDSPNLRVPMDMSGGRLHVVWRRARALAHELRHVLLVFAILPVFWALLYQQNSTWVFQGNLMSLDLGGGVEVPPDVMPSLDDLLCIVFIPMFDSLVFPALARFGIHATPLGRMASGMVSIAIAYVLTGLLELYIDSHPPGTVSILWQVPQYIFLTAGEILVAIPGLEFAYLQAPDHMKSFVTALWGITQALGSAIVAIVAGVQALNDAQAEVFFGYAAAMILFTGVFKKITTNFKYLATAANTVESEPQLLATMHPDKPSTAF